MFRFSTRPRSPDPKFEGPELGILVDFLITEIKFSLPFGTFPYPSVPFHIRSPRCGPKIPHIRRETSLSHLDNLERLGCTHVPCLFLRVESPNSKGEDSHLSRFEKSFGGRVYIEYGRNRLLVLPKRILGEPFLRKKVQRFF